MDWEREDNPWEEHARWSSNCIFVRLSRDNQFVETVRGEVDNAANMYTVVGIFRIIFNVRKFMFLLFLLYRSCAS